MRKMLFDRRFSLESKGMLATNKRFIAAKFAAFLVFAVKSLHIHRKERDEYDLHSRDSRVAAP